MSLRDDVEELDVDGLHSRRPYRITLGGGRGVAVQVAWLLVPEDAPHVIAEGMVL